MAEQSREKLRAAAAARVAQLPAETAGGRVDPGFPPTKESGGNSAATAGARPARVRPARPVRATPAASAPPERPPATVARQATERQRLRLPLVGTLPISTDQAAFLAGLGALGVIGAVEWPVLVVVGVGHALSTRSQSRVIHAFGEGLEG